MPHSQQQQGQITRYSGGQAILANGQQGVSQLQGHLLSQLQPGAVAQVHRDPNSSKVVQFSNHLQPQLRGQMDSRNFGLVQPGQAYNTQMQPPGPLHLSGGSQAHSGNSTPSNGIAGQLQARMASPGLTQPQAQAPAQAQSGGAGGNAHSFPGNQVHLQLNHAQALSQLQGQSTPSQVPSSGLSGGRASPNFNQPSQQTFQSLPKQPTPQPTGQVHSQSHSLNNQTMVNGGQQSRPGTPQSEMSDLRSNA
jgi:cell division septation protein DedD